MIGGRGRWRAGVALPMALVLLLLVEGLAILAAIGVRAELRLLGDDRLATEGWLVAATALAESRLTRHDALVALPDGAAVVWGWTARGDGWRWRAEARREGELVRLLVRVERRDAAGGLLAIRRATLLFDRPASDTLRVLAHRARW